MSRETVYDWKEKLGEGDLVLFDAVPNPSEIYGRSLRTGDMVDVTELEFFDSQWKEISNKKLRFIYENVVFICEVFTTDEGRLALRMLNAAGLLDLIKYQKKYTKDKITDDIDKKGHLERRFFALYYRKK